MEPKAEMESQESGLAAGIDALLRRRQVWLVAAACCFAAVRILIFAAAFPLFNNVDEQDHYEMVYRYAHGFAPGRDLPLSEPETARVFALYGSPEYFNRSEAIRAAHVDIPIVKLPPPAKDFQYQRVFKFWMSQPNIEAQSPPVYYMVGAAWYRAGALMGIKDWALAYWVRFLTAVLYGSFVWVSFLFVKRVYPGRDFLCVAVPTLLAVFPQDVFFGMNRDVLSPLLAAVALLLLFRPLQEDGGSNAGLIAGGFLVGIAFLTDVSNFVLFGALAIVLAILGVRSVRVRRGTREYLAIFGAALAAGLPPLLWMAHNRTVTGDFTGSKAKTAYLGWTIKPWHEIWQHPIFSLHGLSYFFGKLVPLYWRGEYFWHGAAMRWLIADGFYSISSGMLLAVFVWCLWRGPDSGERLEKLSGYLSVYLVLASVLFLAAISLPFDFHQCFYPSRELPYFVSGRIICGTLLPFALIYVSGLEFVFRQVRRYVHPLIPFAAICIFVTCTELWLRSDAFHSAFNFFALFRN
jgi:hypothetical protein